MNNLHMRPEMLKRIREKYPVGCTVEIIEMCDPYRDMPAGLRGTVTHVDDTGTVFADWENGSTLGAVFGEDRIRRVD
jgi:hypothetical protein